MDFDFTHNRKQFLYSSWILILIDLKEIIWRSQSLQASVHFCSFKSNLYRTNVIGACWELNLTGEFDFSFVDFVWGGVGDNIKEWIGQSLLCINRSHWATNTAELLAGVTGINWLLVCHNYVRLKHWHKLGSFPWHTFLPINWQIIFQVTSVIVISYCLGRWVGEKMELLK